MADIHNICRDALLNDIIPFWFLLLLAISLAAGCATSPARSVVTPSGVIYRHLCRTQPRPLQIHVLRIDLRVVHSQLAVAMAPDPDGEGEAETVLVDPVEQMNRSGMLAGINANAWGMVPAPTAGKHQRFVAGGSANICGWVVDQGDERSPAKSGFWSFWMDEQGQPHIGNISAAQPGPRLAVAGFSGLLKDGVVLSRPNETLHPRTALGTDKSARMLTLVVVDGRQKGYSEGMSDYELAKLMRELGCHDALNLDGGGSSVMVLRDANGLSVIVNRPSGGEPRPVPVLLGVR